MLHHFKRTTWSLIDPPFPGARAIEEYLASQESRNLLLPAIEPQQNGHQRASRQN
jgi:hypothetical protein